MRDFARRVDAIACQALTRELALEGKPGLVTPRARGSHDDMDQHTFIVSIDALRGYFGDCAALAAAGGDFAALQARGQIAERAMFAATGGINTHKGAIFTLGLLAAAAGRQYADSGRLMPAMLGATVTQHWGAQIASSGDAIGPAFRATHGARMRDRYGLPGAREHAAAGFPVLFETTLAQLTTANARGATRDAGGVHALLATIATLPDTNLAHRGGIAGLRWAQRAATDFLDRGSVFVPAWAHALDTLGAGFVERWLSPGGSADLLAAAFMIDALGASVPPAARRADAVAIPA